MYQSFKEENPPLKGAGGCKNKQKNTLTLCYSVHFILKKLSYSRNYTNKALTK
jgi:hypothetical protein